jgi:hypothetical protein
VSAAAGAVVSAAGAVVSAAGAVVSAAGAVVVSAVASVFSPSPQATNPRIANANKSFFMFFVFWFLDNYQGLIPEWAQK